MKNHYTITGVNDSSKGMVFLREAFPDGEANELNLVLFSTNGVHGTGNTIEDCEAWLTGNSDEDDVCDSVTFLLIRPRIVHIVYGNCRPETLDDVAFLKKLRASSHRAVSLIGVREIVFS
jgi:hypothetical protein